MSWALDCEDGADQVIVYKALLKSLFATCRATGLCLYDRQRMPLAVINGALATHPVVGTQGQYRVNTFCDPKTMRLQAVDDAHVLGQLATLDRSSTAARPAAAAYRAGKEAP
jgi:hypothetical protein